MVALHSQPSAQPKPIAWTHTWCEPKKCNQSTTLTSSCLHMCSYVVWCATMFPDLFPCLCTCTYMHHVSSHYIKHSWHTHHTFPKYAPNTFQMLPTIVWILFKLCLKDCSNYVATGSPKGSTRDRSTIHRNDNPLKHVTTLWTTLSQPFQDPH